MPSACSPRDCSIASTVMAFTVGSSLHIHIDAMSPNKKSLRNSQKIRRLSKKDIYSVVVIVVVVVVVVGVVVVVAAVIIVVVVV